jgi:hypothetical protein
MKVFMLAMACCALTPSLCAAQGGRALDFDLVCTAKTADGMVEAPSRTFHVQMTDENDATMMEKGVPTPAQEETHTYVNAYLWKADGVDNFLTGSRGP